MIQQLFGPPQNMTPHISISYRLVASTLFFHLEMDYGIFVSKPSLALHIAY
jgi:hypothetical protein